MAENNVFGSIPPIQLPRPRPVGHSRSPSRSPSRQHRGSFRGVDQLFSRLSPTSTLEALAGSSNVSGRLGARSIGDHDAVPATSTEQSFGLRVALASRRVRDWLAEVSSWKWPLSGTNDLATAFHSSSAGIHESRWHQSQIHGAYFEEHQGGRPGEVNTVPNEQPQRQDSSADRQQSPGVKENSSDRPLVQALKDYFARIRSIREGLDELELDDLKDHVLDAYRSLRSRPSSSEGQQYAVATVTILQLLPLVSQLTDMLDKWCLRLSVLQIVPLFLQRLKDAQVALQSAWNALDVLEGHIPRWDEQLFGKPEVEKVKPRANKVGPSHAGRNRTDSMAPRVFSDLTRGEFNIIRLILEDKIASAGQPLDRMLDALEGQEDTMPSSWIDRMEEVEADYGNWVVEAEKVVRINETEQRKVANPAHSDTDPNGHSGSSDGATEINDQITNGKLGFTQTAGEEPSSHQQEITISPSVTLAEPSKEHLPSMTSEVPSIGTPLAEILPPHDFVSRPQSAPPSIPWSPCPDRHHNTNGRREVGDNSTPQKGRLVLTSINKNLPDMNLKIAPLKSIQKADVRYNFTTSSLSPRSFKRAKPSRKRFGSDNGPIRKRSLPLFLPTEISAAPSAVGLTGPWSSKPIENPLSRDNDSSVNIQVPDSLELGGETEQSPQANSTVLGNAHGRSNTTLSGVITSEAELFIPGILRLAKVTTIDGVDPVLGVEGDNTRQGSSNLGSRLHLDLQGQTSQITEGRSGMDLPGALSSQSSPSSDVSSPELRDAVTAVYQKPVVVASRPSSYIGLISPLRSSLPPTGDIDIKVQHGDENRLETRMKLRRRSISYPAHPSTKMYPDGYVEDDIHENHSDHSIAKRASVVSIESVDKAAVRNIILRKPSIGTYSPVTSAGGIAEPAVVCQRPLSLTRSRSEISPLQGSLLFSGGESGGIFNPETVSSAISETDWSNVSTNHNNAELEQVVAQQVAGECQEVYGDTAYVATPMTAKTSPHDSPKAAHPVLGAKEEIPSSGIERASPVKTAKKNSGDQLKDKISSILTTIPAQIRLTSEDEPLGEVSKQTKTLANVGSAPRSRKGAGGLNSYTLAPAKTNSPAPRAGSDGPEVRLYHLRRAGTEAPIKLFIRLVGEQNHQRVMVRVGGGWADLGEYLREYATHHGRRSTSDRGGLVEVKQLATGTPPSSTRPQTKDGRNTPTWNLHSRPASVLGQSNPQPQVRPRSRPSSSSSSHQAPNTPSTMHFAGPLPFATDTDSTPLPTPPSNRSISRLSWLDETNTGPTTPSGLGLAGPKRGKRSEPLSAEKEAWVEDMIGKVRRDAATAASSVEASPADRKARTKSELEFGDLGTVGNVRRVFKRGGSFAE